MCIRDRYKDEDISKLKNRPGRFIKPAPQPVEQKKESTEPKKLPLPEMISISDLAERMKIQPSAIIKKLFLEGKMLTVNSELDFEAAGEIALEYNFDPEPEDVYKRQVLCKRKRRGYRCGSALYRKECKCEPW